ncbi:nucleoside triphosphate pyrophosphohydrolase family protein [uncultured Croceitalea sp.]|uniref:nucleoside triphosphate pyrophosphohydrolase family protein n=1 Tax=uncultured Croceitalea sp. TaxID=1798908 RepID=UPI003306671A
MDFKEYQDKAKVTIQNYIADEKINTMIPFLGIIGEAGSVITELKKKLRDGDSYINYKQKLKEELGDVLWYISTIATQSDIDLAEIASYNLSKIHDRFSEDSEILYTNYDEGFSENEILPDEFEVEFISKIDNGKKTLYIIDKSNGKPIGDLLTDNSYEDDGYRFHDIFHFGYLANLGWSPVIRKLMNRKRRSNPEIDENEDGARAQIIEELISLLIYNEARNHQLLKYSKSIDTGLLKLVQRLVSKLEVKDCSAKLWEITILNSYKVFNELIENDGGRVVVSKKNRRLTYMGKN